MVVCSGKVVLHTDMRALSTADISLDYLRQLSSELGPEFGLDVDERQVVFKSAHPPSWIVFFADADWWIKALTAYAGLYVAEIVKEAGKQTCGTSGSRELCRGGVPDERAARLQAVGCGVGECRACACRTTRNSRMGARPLSA